MATNNNAIFNTNPTITEDWNGGYKLEIDLTAAEKVENWKLDFQLPYTIDQAYGVDLVDNGNGSYTISGQDDQVSLNKSQT